jgi:hypothetical protein
MVNFSGALLAMVLGYFIAKFVGGFLNPILLVLIGGTVSPIGFALLMGILSLFGISAWAVISKVSETGQKGGKKWAALLGKHGYSKVIGITLILIALVRTTNKALILPGAGLLNFFGFSGSIISVSTRPTWSLAAEFIIGAILILSGFTSVWDKVRGATGLDRFSVLGKATGGAGDVSNYIEKFKEGTAVNSRLKNYLFEYSDVLKLLQEEKRAVQNYVDPSAIEAQIEKIIASEGGFDETVQKGLEEAMQKEGIIGTKDLGTQIRFLLAKYRKKKGIEE